MTAMASATSPTAALICLIAFASASLAQDEPETTPEKEAIIANARAYEQAYAKRDPAALANFFTDDAEFLTEDGRSFRGRAEIERIIGAAFLSRGDSELSIEVSSVRSLGRDVLLEKGRTTVTMSDGASDSSLYTAVHVKADGKWRICQLVETPTPEAAPHHHLSELAWLIGKWQESDPANNLTVESQYEWARGGNFITRSVTVKQSGEVTLEGWQVIGWDPLEEAIRSWTFDSEGGFSEGQWSGQGDRWLVREHGVAPDGTRTSSDQTFTKLDAGRFTWESNNRLVNGEPQPGIGRIEITRVKTGG